MMDIINNLMSVNTLETVNIFTILCIVFVTMLAFFVGCYISSRQNKKRYIFAWLNFILCILTSLCVMNIDSGITQQKIVSCGFATIGFIGIIIIEYINIKNNQGLDKKEVNI